MTEFAYPADAPAQEDAHTPEPWRADAERMVACVNACKGIPTSALRNGEAAVFRQSELPDPEKLRLLADFIDRCFPDDANPEVQTDLRRWADVLEQRFAQSASLEPPQG